MTRMSRGERTSAAIFAVLLLTVGLAGCRSDAGDPEDPVGAAPSAVAEPAPATVGDGPLEIAGTAGPLAAARSVGGAPPGILLADDRIVQTTGDDVVRTLDRGSHELVWQKDFTERAQGDEDGICTDPVLAPDGTTLVVGMTLNTIDCARIVLVDLETGDVVSDVPLISKVFADYDTTFYRDIRGFAVVAGRVWWTAGDAVGTVDETGRPATVFGERELHIDDATQVYDMAPRTDDGLFVVEVGHGTPATKSFWREWFGIRPATDGTAEIAWITRERPKDIGFADLAAPLNIELFDLPGAPMVASLTRNRLAVGRLDAGSGRFEQAAVIPWSYLSLFEPSYSRSYAIDGSRLYVAAGPPKDEQTAVVALDIDAGRQLWRTDVTPTPGVDRDELPIVKRVTRGTDGDIYALVGDPDLSQGEIQRFDAETGEQTGVWAVPEKIDYASYLLDVVDDTVVLTTAELVREGLRRSYWLRVAD